MAGASVSRPSLMRPALMTLPALSISPRAMPHCAPPATSGKSALNENSATRCVHLPAAVIAKAAAPMHCRAKPGRGKAPLDWASEYGSATRGGSVNN